MSPCLVETLLTGRHEIMKTGRERSLSLPQIHFMSSFFHVFLLKNDDFKRAMPNFIFVCVVCARKERKML